MSGINDLVSKMLSGDRLALAGLIAQVEKRDKNLAEVMNLLYPRTANPQVIGITGPSGAAKSALVARMIALYRAQAKSVAVVVLDPFSPCVEQRFPGDQAVYFHCGQVSNGSRDVIRVLGSAGFEVILVETGGVSADILKLAGTVVVVLNSGITDSVRVMKTGLLEIADVFVVDQSDGSKAEKLVKELEAIVASAHHDRETWIIPVEKMDVKGKAGANKLLDRIQGHQTFLKSSGKLQFKKIESLKNEVENILSERLSLSLGHQFNTSSGQELLEKLSRLEIDPYQAADLFSGI